MFHKLFKETQQASPARIQIWQLASELDSQPPPAQPTPLPKILYSPKIQAHYLKLSSGITRTGELSPATHCRVDHSSSDILLCSASAHLIADNTLCYHAFLSHQAICFLRGGN